MHVIERIARHAYLQLMKQKKRLYNNLHFTVQFINMIYEYTSSY